MAIRLKHLPYTPIRITSRFGKRNTGIAGASTDHKGIDLGRNLAKYPNATTDGGPVMAVLPGKVTTSTYNSSRGYYLIIDHGTMDGKRVKTLYQHLVAGSNIAVGKTVAAGDTVGRMGNTGVGSLHLHFEVQIGGMPVDPEPYLNNIMEDEDMTEAQVRAIVTQMLAGGDIPSSWAQSTGEWASATKKGIVDGTKPTGYATREQVAAMIVRATEG